MQAQDFKITYLDQENAKNLDKELESDYGHTIPTLMELAGQSVAHAIYDCNKKYHSGKLQKFLVICGPGNNGGDGYTAARHLAQLGYKADVLYTKKPEKELFQGLIKSCEADYVGIFDYSQDENFSKNFEAKIKEYDMIVDAMFGFSFKGPLKEPFDHICGVLKSGKPLIFSIDVPSGWNIEEGNTTDSFTPQYNISLSLPKKCMKDFKGVHYLGGRFLPKKQVEKHGWDVPAYKDAALFIELPKL